MFFLLPKPRNCGTMPVNTKGGDFMSQTISVSTTMGEQGFRDFAVFDAFHHRKAWLRPAVFAAIMLAFAAVCLSQLGKRPGAGLLAAVLAIVGIGLPVSYFLLVLSQRFPADQTDAPAACLLPCGAGRHRHCCVDVRPAGQARTHQPPTKRPFLGRLTAPTMGRTGMSQKREGLVSESQHGGGGNLWILARQPKKAARLRTSLKLHQPPHGDSFTASSDGVKCGVPLRERESPFTERPNEGGVEVLSDPEGKKVGS